mmetsp:Transcript_24886/g.73306  ORF Transcript_24886/g.73306 Transcript_24886/m.73306 type:complete len:211 (+) Transcript_24886:1032-1664(+)
MWPSRVMSMFCGLRSRWMMPDECRYCRPHTASPRKKRAIASSRKPSEESREKQSLHGAYSIAMYRWLAVEKEKKSLMTYGESACARMFFSRCTARFIIRTVVSLRERTLIATRSRVRLRSASQTLPKPPRPTSFWRVKSRMDVPFGIESDSSVVFVPLLASAGSCSERRSQYTSIFCETSASACDTSSANEASERPAKFARSLPWMTISR